MTNDIRLIGLSDRNDIKEALQGLISDPAANDTLAVLTLSVHFRTLQLEFFSVNEDSRRKGIGTDVFEELTDTLAGEDEQWFLQAEYVDDQEHAALTGFFQKQENFFLERRDSVYRASSQVRSQLKMYQNLKKMGEKIKAIRFFSLSEQIRDFFWKELANAGHPFSKGNRNFDEQLCLCEMQGGRISAAIFVCSVDPGEFELYFLYSRQGLAASLQRIFCRVIWQIERRYPEADIVLNAISASERALVNKIFEGRVSRETICVALWNGIGTSMMRKVLHSRPK